MQRPTLETRELTEAATGEPAPKRRTRGTHPSPLDILRVAARQSDTRKASVGEALRTSGFVATAAVVDAVLTAHAKISARRSQRHVQNCIARLGREPARLSALQYRDFRRNQTPSLLARLHALRVRDIRQAAQSAFRHGAAGGWSMNVTFAREASQVGYQVVLAENRTTYAGRYKGWRAREDHHRICVPKDWRHRVAARGLALVDGLMTLDAHALSPTGDVELFAAVWARQGRGFEVHTDQGIIARLGDVHFHAATVDAAIRGVRRKARAREGCPSYAEAVETFIKRYSRLDVEVTLRDAYDTGSCDYGVRSWCAAVGLDYAKGKASLADVLEGFRKRPQVEVRRAVLFALKRRRLDVGSAPA
jgi:hypothetical protein